ncbi:MAG: TonB-dependent receptor [Methylophaga sp.]|nr:TonB-dependent receptor [Methylophaga sp.]
MFKRTILSLACCQIMSLPAIAFAEDSDTGADSLSLGEMVVTTRKREETLQEVPIAITAFSAQLIKDADLQSIEDIAMMTPGFTYTPLFGGRVGNPVIRGMNTTIGEPNVGFFIDGVYQESRGAMEAMFGDEIERIEVAKGPQSALYGRNTFAGAINYVTKQPDNDGEGKLEVTLGNEGRKDARVSYSGAITEDTLFYRVGAMHSGFDGFYKNELTGGNLDEKQSNNYSLSLLALPTDDIEMVFRIGVENTNDGDDAVQFVENNQDFSTNPVNVAAFGPGVLFNDFQSFGGDLPSLTNGFAVTPGHNDRDNVTTSFQLNWDLDNVTFTSITGYNDLELDNAFDSDYQASTIRFSEEKVDQNEFSQELRLTSVDQSIRWMAGAYFYDLDKNSKTRDAFVPGAPLAVDPVARGLAPSLSSVSDESTRNWALFGSVGFDLSDQLALTLSGRYAYEKKEVDTVDTNLDTGLVGQFSDSASFNNFTPKAALDYQLNDNAMVYASVAKAVKSGGFNTATNGGSLPTAAERTYDEEKSLNYEIGVKSSWLDNRLTANLAVFYVKWDDQIVRALGQNFAILNTNAGKSSSRGFELELAAKPAENWDVTAGLSYTDAEYDDYTFGALAALGLNPVLDGNRMQYVSEWTANASVQYLKPAAIAGFDWKTRIDAMYQSEQSGIAIDNPPLIPSRTIVNLRSGLENDKFAVNFWVKNLFDNDEVVGAVAIPNPAQAAQFNTVNGYQRFNSLTQGPIERTYGVTASVKF